MNRQVRALKTRSWACKSLTSRLIIRLLSAESLRSTEVPGGDGSLTKLNNEVEETWSQHVSCFSARGFQYCLRWRVPFFRPTFSSGTFAACEKYILTSFQNAPLVRSPCQTRFSAQWYSCESDAFDQDHVSKNLRNTAEELVWWRRSNAAGLACKPPLWLCW